MITMNPVLLHGRSVWDQSYFPPDERDERLRLVRAEMARDGLQCLLVFGHCTDYGDLCYLTQYIPMVGWSMVVFPAEGDPVLVLGLGGGRDIPSARARTWVADVRGSTEPERRSDATSGRAGDRRAGRLDRCGPEPAREACTTRSLGAIGEDRCVVADDLLARVRRSLRPREISAVRQAARIVQEGRGRVRRLYRRGISNAAALVEADGAARRLGAHDFRGLVNLSESGCLEPVAESHFLPVVTPLPPTWRSASSATGRTWRSPWAPPIPPSLKDARQALEAMVERVRAGTKAGELARLAIDTLGAAQRDGAARQGFGGAVGLS